MREDRDPSVPAILSRRDLDSLRTDESNRIGANHKQAYTATGAASAWSGQGGGPQGKRGIADEGSTEGAQSAIRKTASERERKPLRDRGVCQIEHRGCENVELRRHQRVRTTG
jgi:hypothetical protein